MSNATVVCAGRNATKTHTCWILDLPLFFFLPYTLILPADLKCPSIQNKKCQVVSAKQFRKPDLTRAANCERYKCN